MKFPTKMTSAMQGKICLITGATQGIGRETALALAGLGATVVLVGRNPEQTTAAARMIQANTGSPHVETMLADLSSFQQVHRLVDDFHRRYDRLNVLYQVGSVIHSTLEPPGPAVEIAIQYSGMFACHP